ncbi:hypothetical protein D9M68_876750 [compost metagenome]
MGANGQQGKHPRLLVLAQLLHIAQGALEEGLVVHAPREFQVGFVLEPAAAEGFIESHLRHDLVLGHETQSSALQKVRTKAALAQLCGQALLAAWLVVQ